MHDINEGCIPKFLSKFLKFCFKKKILSKDEFDNSVKFYDYGTLNSANIPSCVDWDKRNLGQNASQSICLFRHLPFILYKYKHHSDLKQVWDCYGALLFVCSVVYSYEITERDRLKLEDAIALHLNLYQTIFQCTLPPKQHHLVHYPRIIREMGPPIFASMMRFDSKHRVFKVYRHATKNFKAINKTLAHQHQYQMLLNDVSYIDDIEWGILKQVEYGCVECFIPAKILVQMHPPFQETKFLHLNNYKFMQAVMVVHDNRFHEIRRIFYVEQEFYFVCLPYVILEFDSFLNSFRVEKESSVEHSFIKFNDLLHFKSYELKSAQNYSYIISDTRDLNKYVQI